ncbi:MAG TPA: V-type ATPase subunit [Nitrososphaeraceae archaeon]|jgi:V/A-type H+-transporting ATPase subunit C|nr:V-type ATPase subunit [Nitrososphaeraceae archaeon]
MSKISMPSKIFGTVLSHGLRGRMLTKGELQTLAESRDMEELVTRIKNTVYLDAFAKLSRPYNAEKIEGALREYLVNTHAKMVNVTGGAGILNAYFVKYITWNLKIVLKGKALGKSYEELLPKINLRAEELVGRRDIVIKALVAKNLEEAVAATAGTEFGEDAAKAATVYKDKGDMRIFDTYLDHVFYHDLGRAITSESQSPDAKKIASTDVDSYNILSILRGKFWGLSPVAINELIISTTSKVPRDTLQKMINIEKISEAVGELANTVYKDIIPQAGANDIDLIMQLEAGFESLSLKRVVSSFRSMFSVGIMLAALKLVMLEVRNLSAIASGIEQKVPPETIVSRLIRVE